jgi:uncharacterized protein YecE (DUF72 family)
MKPRSPIHIGTSGWHYSHWNGPFYPNDLRKEDFLRYYCSRFATVEVNNSFYQLPSEEALLNWRDSTPAGFIFAAKASRYITHMKKLKDPEKHLPILLERLEILGEKLGPILFQLPPRWRLNLERLEVFLKALPGRFRYAFEFRDPSWFDRRAYEALAEHGGAFCIYELAGRRSPAEVTADFVYVRLHGPGEAYQGSYSTGALQGWADRFGRWVQEGKEVFCYFDNDEAGYAAQNALSLQEMVGRLHG